MRVEDVVSRLELVIGQNGEPRRLRMELERQLVEHFALPPIQAAERAERLEARVADQISRICADHDSAGTIAVLTLLGGANDSVAGGCHPLPNDSPKVAELKAHRLQAQPLLAATQALDFKQFESFCAKVLAELGATITEVTPHSGDQGIDFYGVLRLGQYQAAASPFFKLAHDMQLNLVGQAKHYPKTPITPAQIRELVGAISLARTKTFSRDVGLMFDSLALRPFSPLLAILFSTGPITRGAMTLAADAGIIARSGEQIVTFLADRGVGMSKQEDGSSLFDSTKFDAWLAA